ncbi:cytosolic protein [Bacillus safensis]|uniref:cytosolic protein n=1 Tax=Bacillus safensis TaxID=561879 RepID=UPI0011A838B3|nr:cytosolic protein [Bacillus safensis]
MILGQKFKRFMSETADEHPVSELRSHYYKSTNAQVFQAVEAMLSRSDSYQVTSVSAERGEISANIRLPKKAFLVATVISIRPFETAVDFNVTTETALPTDFGYSQKTVLSLYDELDKQLPRIDRS